ncbi:sulfite exporter TauE/SafE family protein [Microlunatus elymi]|nr:sulfite exporter TauE/SafE family protein [Microlunatus elymi]
MDFFDPGLLLGGLGVGIIVGLTGMGGGALMTPMLVFLFKIDPLVAIASDLVTSLFMKPAGAIVHLRRKTVNLKLVLWLCVGSVPAAFGGVFALKALHLGEATDTVLSYALGIALLVAAAGLIYRAWRQLRVNHSAWGEGRPVEVAQPDIVVRPAPIIVLGAVAGLFVGLTSVGSGSIIVVVLLLMFPALKASQLVGTDLVQAVPLVAAAATAHVINGDADFGVAISLLIGAIPGAFIGAQISSRAPGGIVRRALAILLVCSGIKMLGAPNLVVVIAAAAMLVLGNLAWISVRNYSRRRADHRRTEAGLDHDQQPGQDQDQANSSRNAS